MRVAIHQPQYFMWLGLLHKVVTSDTFVYLDNVQFNRRWYQHRMLYSTAGGAKYLTLPISAPGHQIDCVEIKDVAFGEPPAKVLHKHYETLRHRYAGTPGWKLVGEELKEFFHPATLYASPCDLIIASMHFTLRLFGVEVPARVASELSPTGAKDELMLDITRRMGGTVYYSGTGASAYMRPEIFDAAGVGVEYQEFHHPVYRQSHGGPFNEGCAALDFFLEDPAAARACVRGWRERDKENQLCVNKSLSTEKPSVTDNPSM